MAFAVLASLGTTADARADVDADEDADADIGIADAVYVDKSERRLDLLRDGEVIASFDIVLGFEPEGHKTEEGDGKTPEGTYRLDWRNPESRFHLSLHVSYPNEADRTQAEARRVSPGGDIFIHGTPGWAGVARDDWTLGCIAVSNDEIETIWDAVPDGTSITIDP
ncbi:MAG: L,D-transpeptidase family protein [Dongiaceae bacterium]